MSKYSFAAVPFLLIFLSLPLVLSPIWAATLSVTPTNLDILLDSSTETTVQLDTQGAEVNAIDLYLTYPKDLVDVTYINQGSDFQTAVEKSSDNGLIHLSLGALDANSGQLTVAKGVVTVATIGFKAKSLGTGSMNIGNNSAVLDANSSINIFDPSASSNQTLTISQPTTSPTSAQATDTSSPSPLPSNQPNATPTDCQNKKNSITIEMNSIITLTTNLQHKMNNISELLINYYQNHFAKSSTGNSYLQELSTKNTQINNFISTLQGDDNNFSCSNPENQLDKFKTDTKHAENALSDYKSSLIKFASFLN